MAGSIKLFQFFQKFHQTIGIYPNLKQRSTNAIKTIFLIFCAQFIFTMGAFLLFEAKSIFDYGFAFYVFISIINGTAIYLIFIRQLENTLKFIENCERFIKKRVHSSVAYEELIGKVELFNQIFGFAMCATLAFFFITVLPYTVVRYYIFDMGKDSFYLFIPSWYPFDWKTPSGYLVAWLAQCTATVPASVYIQFPNFLIGSCWIFAFIAEDITQDVVAFKTTSNENRAEMTKRFCDVVKIYSDAKQCVKEFNQFNVYSLFAFFTWDLLAASSALVTLQFQLWADEQNFLETFCLFVIFIWMFSFIFLLCEPGARMINQFMILSEELCQFDWYLLSTGMRRMYMIFLMDTQNPIKVLSYAGITCERKTSKKIINTAFSYFMTIRRFRT